VSFIGEGVCFGEASNNRKKVENKERIPHLEQVVVAVVAADWS